MTYPLFLAEPGSLDAAIVGSTQVLEGDEGRHAATVKRLRAGERLLVGDGTGRQLTGTVLAADGAELSYRVDAVSDEPAATPRFTLVQALAKSDRDEAAVEAATEYGIDRVIPWQAERSIVVWRGDRAEKSRQKWCSVVRAAAKQSRRAWVPEVEPILDTAALAARIPQVCVAYVLHEDAPTPLAGRPVPGAGEVMVIVGPEGGISPDELTTLTAAGAVPVRLGRQVLRPSSAGPAAIAVLSAADRWL